MQVSKLTTLDVLADVIWHCFILYHNNPGAAILVLFYYAKVEAEILES